MTSWVPPPPPPPPGPPPPDNQPEQQQHNNNAWGNNTNNQQWQQNQQQQQHLMTNKNDDYIQNRRSMNPRNNSKKKINLLAKQSSHDMSSNSAPPKKIDLFGGGFTNNKPKSKKREKFKLPNTGISEQEIFSKYVVGRGKIGAGAFSQIKKVTRKSDSAVFALKMVQKKGKSRADIKTFQKEITILSQINHENIIKLYDFCDTKQGIYIVIEYCEGGDVMERMSGKSCLTEKEARNITYQTLKGVQEYQKYKIVHRDLKLDNLMYSSTDYENAVVKIIDFGLAGDLNYGPLKTQCGTLHYSAPEVVAGRGYYGIEADLWSIGVIAYMLLSGFPPFFDLHGNDTKLMSLIKKVKYEFAAPFFDEVSKPARDFISKCLVKMPSMRITAKDALVHEWFTGRAPLKSKARRYSFGNAGGGGGGGGNSNDANDLGNALKNAYFNQYSQKKKTDKPDAEPEPEPEAEAPTKPNANANANTINNNKQSPQKHSNHNQHQMAGGGGGYQGQQGYGQHPQQQQQQQSYQQPQRKQYQGNPNGQQQQQQYNQQQYQRQQQFGGAQQRPHKQQPQHQQYNNYQQGWGQQQQQQQQPGSPRAVSAAHNQPQRQQQWGSPRQHQQQQQRQPQGEGEGEGH